MAAGVRQLVGCDSKGAVYRGRDGLDAVKRRFAEETNPENERGTADEVLRGADVFVGLSRPGAVTAAGIRSMARDPLVFAMATPTREGLPEQIADVAAV